MLTDYQNRMMRWIEARDDRKKTSILIYPKPGCRKCNGRGIVGWIENRAQYCSCVQKDFRRAKAGK